MKNFYLGKKEYRLPDRFRDCSGPKERFRYFLMTAEDAVPMFLYVVIYLIWFYLLEHVDREHYYMIHTALDDRIPFCEYFIVPYDFWFVYVVLAMVIFYFKDREIYHRTCAFLAIGMTLFVISSTIWPTMLDLRPAVMPRDNFFTRVIGILYRTDTPTNVTPSIHVYNTIAIMAAAMHTDGGMFRKKAVKAATQIIGVLIILSTVFIKQHSTFDVGCALLLALPVYIMCFVQGFTFNHGRIFSGRMEKAAEHQ